jgi:hypothetical protein
MKTKSAMFCQCDSCGLDIHYGNSIVEICFSTDQFDEESGQLTINPLHEDLLLILCDKCGHDFDDLNEIRRHLSSSKYLPIHAVKTCNSGQDEAENQDTCDGCGAVFGISYIRYSILCISGVIAWNPLLNMGDLTVTDSVEVCPFCQDCGLHIDSDQLQALLLDLINRLQIGRGL